MLKTYGGTVQSRHGSKQLRVIVLARSRVAVHKATTKVGFDVSKHEIQTYWAVSANGKEVASTLAAGEGKVLVRQLTDYSAPYRGARKTDT
jgi:predicted house-cleaning NTP pyrophosphatase (Maf/HAM1 superfamily)